MFQPTIFRFQWYITQVCGPVRFYVYPAENLEAMEFLCKHSCQKRLQINKRQIILIETVFKSKD